MVTIYYMENYIFFLLNYIVMLVITLYAYYYYHSRVKTIKKYSSWPKITIILIRFFLSVYTAIFR